MKQLLEMLLEKLQGVVTYISGCLEDVAEIERACIESFLQAQCPKYAEGLISYQDAVAMLQVTDTIDQNDRDLLDELYKLADRYDYNDPHGTLNRYASMAHDLDHQSLDFDDLMALYEVLEDNGLTTTCDLEAFTSKPRIDVAKLEELSDYIDDLCMNAEQARNDMRSLLDEVKA